MKPLGSFVILGLTVAQSLIAPSNHNEDSVMTRLQKGSTASEKKHGLRKCLTHFPQNIKTT